MLHDLTISGLGVIDSARLPLRAGLTVLTGETGAGKTMVLTGLNLILGGKASADAVRTGAEEAVVEAVLDLPADSDAALAVAEAGARVDEDGTITVTRTVGATTRSRSILGGRTVPQSLLAEVAAQTVTVHGQSDQVRLRTSARQRETLDDYAGPEHRALLLDYQAAWRQWTAARDDLERLQAGAGRSREEIAHLRDALAAIEAVDPHEGEDAALAAEAQVLDNVEAVRVGLAGAHAALLGEGDAGALGAIEATRRSLTEAARHDARLEPLVERLAEFSYGVSDAATEIAGHLDALDADPARLDAVHERRAQLASLARRIGVGLDQIAAFSQRAAAAIAADDTWDAQLAQRAQEEQALRERLSALAHEVSRSRTEAGRRLAASVREELAGLAMPDADFRVEVAPQELGPSGGDAVSMLLAAHPGAAPRPVSDAASGGELSRIMLAIEVSLAGVQAQHPGAGSVTRTFVFDEVDAGVGGRAAISVGARLARLAHTHQVIVVTHLAQVAAYATTHVVVRKSTDGTVTVSEVREVAGEDRVVEIARLLSGQEDSHTARAHALELLESAVVAP